MASMPIDWSRLEEIVEKAVRKARAEELRDLAEAVKTLAEYMKTGFESVVRALEDQSKVLNEHSKRLEELTKSVGELKVAVGSIGRRWGKDLEKLVYELYKDMLLGLGVRDVSEIKKFTYVDIEGKYYKRGARIELDIYAHDTSVYFIEVKSLLEIDDVYWFSEKCDIVSRIIGRTPARKIIVAVNAVKEALEVARDLGVDVVYGSVVD